MHRWHVTLFEVCFSCICLKQHASVESVTVCIRVLNEQQWQLTNRTKKAAIRFVFENSIVVIVEVNLNKTKQKEN